MLKVEPGDANTEVCDPDYFGVDDPGDLHRAIETQCTDAKNDATNNPSLDEFLKIAHIKDIASCTSEESDQWREACQKVCDAMEKKSTGFHADLKSDCFFKQLNHYVCRKSSRPRDYAKEELDKIIAVECSAEESAEPLMHEPALLAKAGNDEETWNCSGVEDMTPEECEYKAHFCLKDVLVQYPEGSVAEFDCITKSERCDEACNYLSAVLMVINTSWFKPCDVGPISAVCYGGRKRDKACEKQQWCSAR